ncbi:uncharacterized protein K460DRAFT_366717 [Cucurbitaria berberidis CBS 394.84]|uniref:Uncharacterized protein n=1 Tax=Cucurbitaria berberidis CBS 394.84 TaxID=1168544 RepID=A0A9P4GGV1_9PLEO|nr:uncharacterized protein K460DRAFT_366717 [Cucurbitaria berberidis CBS 394.84]KAF1845868.1 hypothetical protein K460DRAFT_366717 [Cucurbitaria berberidis CBS 394.84]
MLSCQTCQKTFTCQKHLSRHQVVHGDSRPFQCGVCFKAFSRKDGLQRHESTHRGSKSLVQIKGRACAACVSAKTRCTGVLPCQRCVNRKTECTYTSRQGSLTAARGRSMTQESLVSGECPAAALDQSTILEEPSAAISQQIATSPPTGMSNQPLVLNGPSEELSEELSQPVITRNHIEALRDSGWPQYTPDLLGPESLNLNLDVQSLPSNPIVTAHHELVHSQFGWEPSQSSTINWLQMEAVDLGYFPMRDFFPTALSAGALSSPESWHHSVRSPTFQSHSDSGPTAVSVVNTDSPQESVGHATASNVAPDGPSIETDVERGSYYVDGDKARQTRRKRRRLMTFTPSSHNSGFSFASCTEMQFSSANIHDHFLDERQHGQLEVLFQSLCVNTLFFQPFLTTDFPSQEVFHHLVQGYLISFHQALPFIHRPTFRGYDRHHTLLLAMAALGARFSEHEAAVSLSAPLTELLRRIMMHIDEDRERNSLSEYEMAQIRLLYSVTTRYTRAGQPQRDAMVAVRECTSTFDMTFRQHAKHRSVPQNQTQWLSWVHQEEITRTKFCIWLLDCMVASHTGSQPALRLAAVTDTQLPCTESLWSAESWNMWNAVKQSSATEPPTIEEALRDLYIEKQLSPNLGEFSRIMIVHALYHRTWDVREYFEQRLSHYVPSAQRQSSADVPSPLPAWHPRMESFNKWRNAALDCIDILHWNANALIGLAQGMEHHTVLHLHFSRIVLLCPIQHVLRLARFLSETSERRSSSTSSVHEAEHDARAIQQWVAQDKYKARLATVHAGTVLWHVRRYSSGAFYEPECVALATLMLWAHSKFFARSNHNPEDTISAKPGHLRADRDIILLDRPTDDELVQQYVREGDLMHANMKGVGDLFGPSGAHRVLVQGRMLLGTLGAWQEATSYWTDFLKKLEYASAGRSDVVRQ